MSERRDQILSLEEAVGRRELATHLADRTSMSLADVRAALNASPVDLLEATDVRDAGVVDRLLASAGYPPQSDDPCPKAADDVEAILQSAGYRPLAPDEKSSSGSVANRPSRSAR